MLEHGERDLKKLLAGLDPVLLEGVYVYSTQPVTALDEMGFKPLASFQEAEGITIILREEEAKELGWAHRFPSGLIRLSIHSDLSAVGLLAHVTGALAAESIPVNVISAFYHDYLLIPVESVEKALQVLAQYKDKARAEDRDQ